MKCGARGLIEGRDAHQPVHAGFGRQQAVSVFTFHSKRHSFETRFFTRLVVDDLGLEAALLGPFQIHPQQHLGPVLRFGPARARMNGADGVQLIVFAGQQHLSFRNSDLMLEALDQVRASSFNDSSSSSANSKSTPASAILGFKLFLSLNLLFQRRPLLQKFLRRFLIAPKIRRRSLVLDTV